jgi:hypothetical protein
VLSTECNWTLRQLEGFHGNGVGSAAGGEQGKKGERGSAHHGYVSGTGIDNKEQLAGAGKRQR